MHPFLAAIRQKRIVLDGAMGTMVQALDLPAEAFGGRPGLGEALVLHRPGTILAIHRAYLDAGADGVETATFGANRVKLGDHGLATETTRINREASALARRACEEASARDRRPRFVVGSMGPTGRLPSGPDGEAGDRDELEEVFREQAEALLAGGADVLLVETGQDLLEVQAAVAAAVAASTDAAVRRGLDPSERAPVVAQVTLAEHGRMLLGTEPSAVVAVAEGSGADVVGINCGTGPAGMAPALAALAEWSELPLSCLPNAGLPRNEGGRAHYDLCPTEFSASLADLAVRFGVAVVGGCCGTTPEHIRALVEAVRHLPPAPARPRRTFRLAAGPVSATALRQEPRPLIVGERLNAQGSRRARDLIMADDLDGLADLAREQLAGGAHALDVCVTLPGEERRRERERMSRIVRHLSRCAPATLMLDSTEPEVLAAGLAVFPGRAILNSVNLEDGGRRLAAVAELARRYGAALVALTIDEKGMALEAARKVEVAVRLVDLLAGTYGIDPRDIILDLLTFTLGTGDARFRRAAVETLEGLRLVRERLPSCPTILGVSNVSYGLPGAVRRVLNAVFLERAVAAGLDVAIVHAGNLLAPGDVPPGLRSLAEDVVEGREGALGRLVEAVPPGGGRGSGEAGGLRAPVATVGDTCADLAGLPPRERLRRHVLDRRTASLDEALRKAMAEVGAPAVLADILLPAMQEVGDRFAAGELILPFVLQSAEIFRQAVTLLEPHLPAEGPGTAATVVLATVAGDVHDIGKNLVRTVLANNGFRVVDLGRQVPVSTIVEAVVRERADLVGLSALLVSTSRQMPLVVDELRRRGLAVPVLVGGAAVTPNFAERCRFGTMDPGTTEPYAGGVFYCRDAFDGLRVARSLVEGRKGDARGATTPGNAAHEPTSGEARPVSAAVKPADHGASPPAAVPAFMGSGTVLHRPSIQELASDFLDVRALLNVRWGLGRLKDRSEATRLRHKLLATAHRLLAEAKREGWLEPGVAYGVFRVSPVPTDALRVEGPMEDAVVLPVGREPGRRVRTVFDRVVAASAGSGTIGGVRVALWAATVGPRPAARTAHLMASGRSDEALLVHGLAAEMAEALAAWAEARARKDLGLPPGTGRRLSPGYPAWPDLSAQHPLLALLDPEGRLGLTVSPDHQLVPEYSTTGIFF